LSSLVLVAALVGSGACQSSDGDAEAADESESGGEIEGDDVRGGALYDTWWVVTGQDQPIDDHPLWASRPDTQSNTARGARTWRCQECHGWDYAGVDGAYGEGEHHTGFPGILGSQASEAEIIELLTDPAGHAYGERLDEQSLADLAAFVRDGTLDTTTIIIDGRFMGAAMIGKAIYERSCAQCHGNNGLTLPPGADEDFANFPGFLADENPQEFLHKVRFGQPGTIMPPQANELSNDALAALGTYAQRLPPMQDD
jgi:mono/diheme cytochrome c family protein